MGRADIKTTMSSRDRYRRPERCRHRSGIRCWRGHDRLHVVFTPTAHGIDADNLARKIVPIVVERLRPPTTQLHTFDLAAIDDPRMRRNFERLLEGYRRVPRIALTKYEVTRVSRSPPDPDHGFVKLSLGDGTTPDSLLDPVLSHVEEWADKVERTR